MTFAARARAALFAAAAVVAVMNAAIWLAGAQPLRAWSLVLAGTLGSAYGVGQALARATPLALTGAAVALALRAGLFNIGAEGQLLAGILAAAYAGARLPSHTPFALAVPAVLCAAALAGAALGGLAGYLRGRFGAHEVITTLMLNGLMAVLGTYLFSGPFRAPGQIHSAAVVHGARLPRLGAFVPAFRGSALNLAVVLALAAPFAAALYLARTAGGLRIRALGSNPPAARALGVSLTGTTTRAMALSGALAGLAGVHYVLGAKGFAEEGMGAGVGFVGIAVAMLGGRSPAGIVLAAVLFGALSQGGLAVNAIVPADVFSVAQAAIIVAVGALAARGRTREGR